MRLSQAISQHWNNFSFRTKLSILLVFGIGCPMIAVTQGMIHVAQNQGLRDTQRAIAIELKILEEELKEHQKRTSIESDLLANIVSDRINDEEDLETTDWEPLLELLSQTDDQHSFQIIANGDSQSIAQKINIIEESSGSSSLAIQSQTAPDSKFRTIEIPQPIDLKGIQIIEHVLQKGQPLTGIELLSVESLKKLGLAEQANIGLRPQKVDGLPEEKQPFPTGTYDIDQGQAGLVIMSVSPIIQAGEVVGVVTLGSLINHNYTIVDKVKNIAGVSTATIFAKDWRVSTNVPYTEEDGAKRAIGTRVSREVADVVLNKGEVFLGQANIIGREYLTGYSPIYDHLKNFAPNEAKPVGIAYVGEPLSKVTGNLRKLAIAGYSIGGGVLVVAILIILPITDRWFIKPILYLNTVARNLAEKNWDQEITIRRNDELGQLAQSIKQMSSSLHQLYINLEKKVQERTTQLATANDEIKHLNEQLKADNQRLGSELDIARKIQQMILPRNKELDEIEGLDIAGYMESADEVGGDYYDVLSLDGVVTIGIGDVTGHGLESGLLMLMTQTAVRTLQEVREKDPIRFLDTLNRTIYRNVQRMNSEKNLTLAILNYSQQRLSISGQHEETLIVRADGTVERIDTMDLGLPIGLDDDILDFIDHKIVELKEGDGVVLYTDGITEAYNMQKEQYGIDRLCEVISQNWQKSATEIKESIIADLHQYIGEQKIFDDITLLVFKQLPN